MPRARWRLRQRVASVVGVASWIGSKGQLVANVHRVLTSRGEITPGWTPAGPGLPPRTRGANQPTRARPSGGAGPECAQPVSSDQSGPP